MNGNAGVSSDKMMRIFKLLTLLIVCLLVFGSAAFFGYELFLKPSRAEKQEKAQEAAAPLPTPTPDPGIPEFQRIKTLYGAGKLAEVHEGFITWIANNPKSALLPEARQLLGKTSMTLLFQPDSTNVVTYSVIKGDSLARIAAKHQSNAELIQKANSLPSINLQIGEQLVIPSLKIAVDLDRSAKSLTLFNNGSFLKQYSLLSIPSTSRKEPLISKVLDKVATAGNKRVAFGDKAYAQSDRSILLVQAPAIVALPAAPTGATNSTNAPSMPGGYVLSAGDLLEIFPLVSRNTPVTIH